MPCIRIPNGILTLAGDYQPGDMGPIGYMEREEWAVVQMKAGLHQVACGRCGEWKFPQELSDKYHRTTAINRRGEVVKLIDSVCLQCAAKEH